MELPPSTSDGSRRAQETCRGIGEGEQEKNASVNEAAVAAPLNFQHSTSRRGYMHQMTVTLRRDGSERR